MPNQALLIVDVQNDFCPGGALAVPEGDAVVPVCNKLSDAFARQGHPVYFSRDWHPPNHCSFEVQGGPWPPHCVRETEGAAFHPDLDIPEGAEILTKGTEPDSEAYSAFLDTGLAEKLHRDGVDTLIVAGLATDYCVKNSVLDACKKGFSVRVVREGIRAVDVEAGDGEKALDEMREAGAEVVSLAREISET